MKYALLIYSQSTPEEYADIVAATRQAAADSTAGTGPWVDYTRAAREAGVFAGAEQLTHDETATSLRAQDGGRVLTDGPFIDPNDPLPPFPPLHLDDLPPPHTRPR